MLLARALVMQDPMEENDEEKVIKYRDFIKALKLPRREVSTDEAERLLRTELDRLARLGRERPNFVKLFDEVGVVATFACLRNPLPFEIYLLEISLSSFLHL